MRTACLISYSDLCRTQCCCLPCFAGDLGEGCVFLPAVVRTAEGKGSQLTHPSSHSTQRQGGILSSESSSPSSECKCVEGSLSSTSLGAAAQHPALLLQDPVEGFVV